MSWPQVLLLAFTILGGIVSAVWAIVRPLVKTLFETIVVGRLKTIEEKLDKNHQEHGGRIRDIELKYAELRGALSGRRCPAVTEADPVSRCAP